MGAIRNQNSKKKKNDRKGIQNTKELKTQKVTIKQPKDKNWHDEKDKWEISLRKIRQRITENNQKKKHQYKRK